MIRERLAVEMRGQDPADPFLPFPVRVDAVGIEDLRPGSQVVHDLNTSTKPVTVPYFIVAGLNQQPANIDANAWNRLRRKVMEGVDAALDTLFGDQNDMVIGLKSMLGVRNGNYPANLLKTREVPCTHGEYFSTQESEGQLVAWMQ